MNVGRDTPCRRCGQVGHREWMHDQAPPPPRYTSAVAATKCLEVYAGPDGNARAWPDLSHVCGRGADHFPADHACGCGFGW